MNQKELFESLRKKAPATDKEALPPFVKFSQMGDVIQGIVVDTYATTAYDPGIGGPAKDKNGNEIPQLNVTLEFEDGTVKRQSFANDLLWKLNAALQDIGLDELPKGAILASKWESMFVNSAGKTTRAREHAVIVKVPE